ncbi:MAG TPA: metal ABC transporter substrate-binding protein, partial [Cyanobacteria bacterium UBA11162]|nr:metal ABC transporter substrate-binding protein [Cyanobacteria bacterium UBA11162]
MLQNLNIRHLAGFTLLMGVVGCSSPPPQAPAINPAVPDAGSQSRPSVVATTSILCDLTKQVAGETIDLKCLVGRGVDPHLYQPKPEDRKAMDSANLIFYAGYDFDPSLVKLVKATSNPVPKIAVHEVAVPQPILGETHDHGDEKHAHAEGETAPDPHIWHDAQNGIRMVETISNSLEKLIPNHTSLYNNNAQKITAELQQIDTWINSQIATISPAQRKLVTTHDALGYYVKAYGLSFEGALGGFSTEEAPTAARVSELVKEIKSAGVPTIFAETTINPKLIERVAKEAKVKVSDRELFADGLGEPGKDGESYQEML